jgi:hypothetical protein
MKETLRRVRTTAGLSVVVISGMLTACAGGGGSSAPVPVSTGAAGGATSVGGDASLQSCPAPVGTVRLQDGQAVDTRGQAASNQTIQDVRLLLGSISEVLPSSGRPANEGVSLDAMRLLIQQSNCLVIVDRGASEAAATDEKRRARAPNSEMRDDANMGPGQEVAADFVLRSSVINVETGQTTRGGLGAFVPRIAQGITGSMSTTTAKVQLVLSDVRAKIQLAVAQGDGSGSNVGIATSVLGIANRGVGVGSFSTESKTSTATIILQAYADAYNKLVPALRDYKAQNVKGGLGAGGTLKVQGATDSSGAKK